MPAEGKNTFPLPALFMSLILHLSALHLRKHELIKTQQVMRPVQMCRLFTKNNNNVNVSF